MELQGNVSFEETDLLPSQKTSQIQEQPVISPGKRELFPNQKRTQMQESPVLSPGKTEMSNQANPIKPFKQTKEDKAGEKEERWR